MRISLVQCAAPTEGIGITLNDIEKIIGYGSGADIYVLPELFATGQCADPAAVVQEMDGQIVQWMLDMASRLDAAIAGSVTIKSNNNIYNRFCLAKPDGNVDFYDKRHLFSYSGENRLITAGRDRIIMEFRGLRILPQVCYDLRFPVFSRNRDDYDIVLYVANWPVKRQIAWDILLRARAIENQAFAAGVNIVGEDMFGTYEGHSALISPYGEYIAVSDSATPQIITGDLDMDRLAHFRSKFPVIDDADRFW